MAASHVVPRVRTDSASPFDLANEWNHEQKVESRYLPRTRDSPERRQKGRWGRDIKARRGRGYQQRSVLKDTRALFVSMTAAVLGFTPFVYKKLV